MYYLSGKQMTEWKVCKLKLFNLGNHFAIENIKNDHLSDLFWNGEVTYNEVYDFWKFNLVRFPLCLL